MQINRWRHYSQTLLLAYLSFGIVYGDLSTSPLYVYKSIFSGKLQYYQNEDAIFGVFSLIFWTLTLIPLLKYVIIVLSADDNGEGGTFALYSLLCRHAKVSLLPNQQAADEELSTYYKHGSLNRNAAPSPLKRFLEKYKRLRTALLLVVLFGASMVIGDGVLTPAISGEKSSSAFSSMFLRKSDFVLMVHCGTHKVAFIFAPVVVIWLFSIAVIGLYNIIHWNPRVFHALSPLYVVKFFRQTGKDGWVSLGGVLLCITGAEAMFADLGHFTTASIRLDMVNGIGEKWKVCHSLVCCHGQSADDGYRLQHNGNEDRFEKVMVLLLKVIGAAEYFGSPNFRTHMYEILRKQTAYSLAVISATFSIVKQCHALGCFPRVKQFPQHSDDAWVVGSTFSQVLGSAPPSVALTIALLQLSYLHLPDISTPKSKPLISQPLASSPLCWRGIACMTVMFVTTWLMALVIIFVWQKNILLALAFIVFFGAIEGVYLSSSFIKVPQGGWAPLVLSGLFMFIMYVWHYGTRQKYLFDLQNKVSMKWILTLGPSLGIVRTPGIGLIYTELVTGVPAIFSHFVTNLPAFHQVLVFVCIKSVPVPYVPTEERYLIGRIGPRAFRMYRCIVRYGYKDVHKDEDSFENHLVMSIAEFIQMEAEGANTGSMESSLDGRMAVVKTSERFGTRLVMLEDSDVSESITVRSSKSEMLQTLQSVYELESPEVSRQRRVRFTLPESVYFDPQVREELMELIDAKHAGITYVMGHSYIKARRSSSYIKKFVIDVAYSFFRKNCRGPSVALNIPHISLIEVGMSYHV
ncbi:Potassium transporter 7 [Asimina triloba]